MAAWLPGGAIIEPRRPLFVTGTARSGSNLLARMLSANAQAMVACDPYFPLFPALRSALAIHHDPGLKAIPDRTAPLSDYYFTTDRIRLLDAVQAGDLSAPFDRREWPGLRAAIAARAAHECADLVPHVDALLGATFRDVIDHGLEIIARARRGERHTWVGFKEVWTVEFFAPLARAYRDAAFIILVRDPRAVVASMQRMEGIDRSQIAHTLSYARHWRKSVAFAVQYAEDPLFVGRLMLLTYEQIVREPDKTARALCDFLAIDHDPAMLDTAGYADYTTGGTWRGNSSFETSLSTISAGQVERWRSVMERHVLETVEFVCGPEMRLLGYEPETAAGGAWPGPGVLEYLVENGRQRCSWRTDLGDPQADYGFELFRRALLTTGEAAVDVSLVRRSFLFERVFHHLCARGSRQR